MRVCFVRRYDSFTSVRGNFEPLFSSLKGEESLRRAVRQHICHVPWRYKNSPRRRASWLRGNFGLIFEEARRRRSYAVARAAVEVVLERQQQQEEEGGGGETKLVMESTWVKSAFAACRLSEELREMKALLAHHCRVIDGKDNVESQLSPVGEERDGSSLLLASTHDGNEDGGAEAQNFSLIAAGYSSAALATLRRQRDDVVTAPNVSFSRYFTRQGLVADEMELMELFKAMRGRPSVAFRVHTSQICGKVVEGLLRNRVGIEPLPWLPSECGAFMMLDGPDTPHNAILSNRQLLRALANERLISFQSTSSMLPILLLDPRPNEAVLDMCASPGSKTALILDYMSSFSSSSSSSSFSSSVSTFRSGCVVANDAVASRGRSLAQRLQNVSPRVAVTQLQGQNFPAQPIFAGGVRYDKVLVDAPCSGEGRMRRDAMSWRMWHPLKALEFFPTQLALLRRAVELCASGGCVVYSTCTLNPLENEAVVAAVLADGGVELVRPPRSLTAKSGWNFSCGLRRWLVPSRAGGFLHTFAEAEANGEEGVVAELFPPDKDEKIQLALESCCLRVLPHRNGGAEGFFLAALRKVHHKLAFLPSSHQTNDENHNKTFLSKCELLADSILHTRGVVRLAVESMLLRRHLGVFFNDNPTQLEEFLKKNALCAAWQEGYGLLLVSERTWCHLKAIPSAASVFKSSFSLVSKPTLLEVGVRVIDAVTGCLTENGAFHLRPYATSRVLHIPFRELNELFSHQVLRLSEFQEDPKVLAQRIIAGTGSLNHQIETPLRWVVNVFNAIASHEGNFIVSCLPSSVNICTSNSETMDMFMSLSIPVIVRKSSTVVELHLSLSHDARQRYMAIIGRLLAHMKRVETPGVAKHKMQIAEMYNVSKIMNSANLEGRRLTSERQHRKLYSSSSSSSSLLSSLTPTSVTMDCKTTEANVCQESLHMERQQYFEV